MMRFCEHHEGRMRALCCDLGLESTLSRDEAHLAARKARHDPYDLDALDMTRRALMALAVQIVRRNDIDAHMVGCPLCFFVTEAIRMDWMGNVARRVRERVREAEKQRQADIERNREIERAQR
jgi:hypothetical protein